MKITMNAPEYFNEHKRLIKLLLSVHRAAFLKEAREQIAEVKKQRAKIRAAKAKARKKKLTS
jgi:hypothetical protein